MKNMTVLAIYCSLLLGCAEADLNDDGVVGTMDLLTVLEAWGLTDEGDIFGNGTTDINDLTYILIYFGVSCGG